MENTTGRPFPKDDDLSQGCTAPNVCQPDQLSLWNAWLNWPCLCLVWYRDFNDAWIAHWGGGVPLDG